MSSLDTLHLLNLRPDSRPPLSARPPSIHLPPPPHILSSAPPGTPAGEAWYSAGLTSVRCVVLGPARDRRVPPNHPSPPITVSLSAPAGVDFGTRQEGAVTVIGSSYERFQGSDVGRQGGGAGVQRLQSYVTSLLSVFTSSILLDPFSGDPPAYHLSATVLSSDGSLLPALVNGFALALQAAGVPMLDTPVCVQIAGMAMVERGREVAATLKAVMVANAKDFVRAGFEARQGEGEVRCEGGIVVID
ncbi:hypothetical protein TeGR_g1598 [Tetraparma gracilis]|uniref:Uncharacterized protein n=1 Tax=Tetraparma gracilis TaxID=2962635 RepID=A0ABQ6MZ98_9STRA|nr:hypothetical protein TeGR_g1598 [Tetraparma gracilis]